MSSKDVSVGDALKDAPAEAAGMFGRLFAGLSVDAADIMAMGAGGLLQEIKSRPSPREG